MTRTVAGRSVMTALALAVAAASFSAPAYAQTEQATREAEARFKEGLRRHDSGDEEGARLSFLEAFSVLKRPNILFNLARAEQLTGHPVEAIGHYKLFVADNTVTGSDRELARKRIAELTPLVGHVTIVAPSGADLWIDGQMLPRKAPLGEPADVSAGSHTVQARIGDQTKSTQVSCTAGQTVTATIDIVLNGPGLVVVPIPGETPPAPPPAPAPAPVVHYEPSGAKIVTVVVLGVGAVGLLAGGIGLEAASSSASSTASTDRAAIQKGSSSTSQCVGSTSSACSNLASELSSHSTDTNAAVGLFVGAGVLAGAAVVTWAVWPKAKIDDEHLYPIVSPSMAGLGWSGSF